MGAMESGQLLATLRGLGSYLNGATKDAPAPLYNDAVPRAPVLAPAPNGTEYSPFSSEMRAPKGAPADWRAVQPPQVTSGPTSRNSFAADGMARGYGPINPNVNLADYDVFDVGGAENPIGPRDVYGPKMPPGQRYGSPIGPAEMQGPKLPPPQRGAWADLKATGSALRNGLGRAGQFIDDMMGVAAPVLNHPVVATAGRGLALAGSAMDAKSGYDAIAQGAAESNKRMDAAYHRGGDSYLSPEYLGTLGRETLGQTYAGVKAMPLVGSIVRGAEGLQDWATGKNAKPAAPQGDITYDEATQSFSRAPTNMAEYKQMMAAREAAQQGLPKLHALTTNGNEVALTPNEVKASPMRAELMQKGFTTNPNTDIRMGEDGIGMTARSGGSTPLDMIDAITSYNQAHHGNNHTLGAMLSAAANIRGTDTTAPYYQSMADYNRTRGNYKPAEQAQAAALGMAPDAFMLQAAIRNPATPPALRAQYQTMLSGIQDKQKFLQGVYSPNAANALDMNTALEEAQQRQRMGLP